MNEQAIRKIVDDEIKKKLFQLPKIPPHKHDGTDNINIPATSVTPPIRAMATRVRFNENQNYTFYFPSISPQMVLFEGYALQNTSVTKFTMTSSLSAGANFGTLTSTWGGSTENLLVTFSSGETFYKRFIDDILDSAVKLFSRNYRRIRNRGRICPYQWKCNHQPSLSVSSGNFFFCCSRRVGVSYFNNHAPSNKSNWSIGTVIGKHLS